MDLQGSPLYLDWRLPKRGIFEHVSNSLGTIIRDIDMDGYAMLEYSKSVAAGAIEFRKTNLRGEPAEQGNVHMFIRKHNATKRFMDNLSTRNGKTVNLCKVASSIIDYVEHEKKNSRAPRGFQYQEESKAGMSKQQFQTLVYDLALSAGIHHAFFGIYPPSKGIVACPPGLLLQVDSVVNVFEWAPMAGNGTSKENGPGRRTLHFKDTSNPIPPFILSARSVVDRQNLHKVNNKRPRAVLVIEHRNQEALTDALMHGGHGLEKVFVVMHGGSPDIPCREFLNCLAKSNDFANVPFLYVSDHDFAGFDHYLTLKYGSRPVAWLSPNLVCPPLQYVGPTIRQLEDLIELSSADEAGKEGRLHPRWTTDDLQQEKERLANDGRKRFRKWALDSHETKMDVHQRSLLKYFKTWRFLDLEPALKQEVAEMQRTRHQGGLFTHIQGRVLMVQQQFNLNSIPDFVTQGIARYFVNVVAAAEGSAAPDPFSSMQYIVSEFEKLRSSDLGLSFLAPPEQTDPWFMEELVIVFEIYANIPDIRIVKKRQRSQAVSGSNAQGDSGQSSLNA